MTTKIVEQRGITPTEIGAAKMAYDSFPQAQPLQKRDHLNARFRHGVSCGHRWRPIDRNVENEKYLKSMFEEQDLGPHVFFCPECGATSLWDDGLWAYDATTEFFGSPPKAKPVPVTAPRSQRDNRK
jgi:hypothetical protein